MTLFPAEIAANLNEYSEEGLYLLFPETSFHLTLTLNAIKRTTEQFWEEINQSTVDLKKIIEFQRCSICTHARKNDFCDALRPILPFLDIMEKFDSFTKVTAIYRDTARNILSISETTMQNALQFISILSLTHYCQVGQKYRKYYWGINPLLSSEEVANQLLLNIFWVHKGDKQEIQQIIAKFSEEIRIMSKNQVNRLNLICKSDTFKNSFVNAQIAPTFLRFGVSESLAKRFNDFKPAL